MYEEEFTVTESGVIGIMPSGEEREFATEDEYHEAYTEEENEIIDELAVLHEHDEVEYPEDWDFVNWLEYA